MNGRTRVAHIKDAIRARGWSVRTLAMEAGYNYEYVRRVVAGTKRPSRDLHDQLCRLLDLPVESTWRAIEREGAGEAAMRARAVPRQRATIAKVPAERRGADRLKVPWCPWCESARHVRAVGRTPHRVDFRCENCGELMQESKPSQSPSR